MSTYDVLNPATEEVVTTIELHDVASVDRVIDQAYEASIAWRKVTPADRGRLLRRFAEVVDAHIEELAQLEVANAGHTIGNARWEAGNVRDVLHYYEAAPERHIGKQIPVAGGIDITFYEPLGVVGIIVPWNFPMPIAGWGFAPALAAGNTVVMKPAMQTPLTALRLAELALEAGIPEGVFNVVAGGGSTVGYRLVTNEKVRKVCFTGSSAVGKQIMAGAADQMKRVTLELGGKSANIIFADADLEKAAAGAPYAVFDNAGISPADDDSILTTGVDAWQRVQDVNLKSVYLCCKYGIPLMQEKGKGSIINVASFVAVMGSATSQISYTASKGGVLSMTRELGVQFAREGIRVNALCPGPVNTPLLQELFAKDPERAARRLVHVPMGRFGEPEEMASAVLFLASDDSSFMTANTFLVDGGLSAAYVTPL